MNQLDDESKVRIISALAEGNSIRSTSRMTGIARNTISSLLVSVGAACARYQDATLRNLSCKRVQADEIWSFCYAKDKNVPVEMRGKFGVGSVWTWTAIDADTKLICSWMVGNRDAIGAYEFMKDLSDRLANRIQLTTDGLTVYLDAVDGAFGSNIDYAMLVKIYGETQESERRYSPAECIGAKKKEITGTPDVKHISTSYVERQNLTMRMHMRRFTRLTNAFSKKIENHIAAISMYFMYYNFVRIHQTLRITPAMAAGVTDHVWEVLDVVKLVDRYSEERKREAMERHQETIERAYNPFGPVLGHE